MKVLDTEQADLLFSEEPYEYKNRPLGIDKKYRIFIAGDGKQQL
jgi:hypothetical protein